MEIAMASAAFLAAALCAGLMGYAIQRGATCTVAAVDEIVTRRTFGRLGSLLEAAVWVGGGLVVAATLHALPHVPAGHAASGWTVLGGALLGLGAYVNRACVFGTVARLGNGEWAYVVTPLGFYIGCLTVDAVFAMPAPNAPSHASPVLSAASWLLVPFLAFAAWRIAGAMHALRPAAAPRLDRAWSPHVATTAIGLTFLAMLLLVGAWAYTDVLAELARGMAMSVPARVLLLVALFGGAMLGGWTDGRWRHLPPTPVQLLRCFVGGVLMGWGSLLIPGGNDGLILVGMPLAWPYAWLAFATMCATVAAAQVVEFSHFGHGRATARRPR
jgi:toxin CptA